MEHTVNEELNKLKSLRRINIAQINRFETFLNNISSTDNKIEEIKIRLQKVDDEWYAFQKIQCEIELNSVDNLDSELEERQLFEDKYFSLTSLARTLIEDFQAGTKVEQKVEVSHDNVNVKLPLINLPNFFGTYEGWLPFREGFTALVLGNESLNNVQKFYYLLSCLKGDSMQVIQSLKVTDNNFPVAWKLLQERYENHRVIVHSHVKRIFELPTMTKENHSVLRKIIDTFQKHFRSLQSLGQPVEQWDTLLIYIINNKLDFHSRKEWESSIKTNEVPNLSTFIDFLKNKAQLLETLNTKEHKNISISHEKPIKCNHITTTENNHTHMHSDRSSIKCNYCKGLHFTFKCEKLLSIDPKHRYAELKKHKICSNCLRLGHYVDSCRSERTCLKCKKKHNTILHVENWIWPGNQLPKDQEVLNQNANTITHEENTTNYHENASLHSNTQNTQILLSTTQMYLKDVTGQLIKCRGLLDSGSQSNFITERLFKKLNLNSTKINLPVAGINHSITSITHRALVQLSSLDLTYSVDLPFLVIPNITGNIPQSPFDPRILKLPTNVVISDESYYKPGEIDVLLGNQIFFSLLKAERLEIGNNLPIILQNTKLGCLVLLTIGVQLVLSQH